jgi:hypothetical protein
VVTIKELDGMVALIQALILRGLHAVGEALEVEGSPWPTPGTAGRWD